MNAALTRDLARLLGPDAVSDDPADQSAYAHDLWPRQLISTRGGLPRPGGPAAIAWPSSRDALAELVRFARAQGLRVTPFGAGSAVTGALALSHDTIAVDMKRLRALHEVDLARGTADIDAGILGEHLEEKLQRRGATLGHFPSSIYCSTLGGWLATRSAGQCSGRYGKIEDMALALEGVLGDGEPFVCGPPRPGDVDARALIVGSEGLFGFITRAVMRVWPAPTERRFAALSYKTMREAWTAIRAIYQAGLRPAVARLYDPFDTYIFRTGGRSHGPRKHSAGEKRPLQEYLLRRLLPHADALNVLNARLGERVFGRSLLVLMFEGTRDEGLGEACARAVSLAREGGGREEGEALARRWLARRHAVSYRQPPTYARGLWVDTMEVAAPWARLEALYEGVRDALSEGGFVMAHMSHAYPDGCSIYFTFAGADPTDAEALARYERTWARALVAAHTAGGTISHHHGIGRSKRDAMRLELGAGVDAIAALARAADPGSVLARGALVPPSGAPEHSAAPATLGAPSAEGLVAIDRESCLATLVPDLPLDSVHTALARHGFTLPDAPREGTVAAWLAHGEPSVRADPVDHRVAGFRAHLPSGGAVRVLPAPRRAAGPDLFTLFAAGGGRFGQLDAVTVRVRGPEETPAWTAPCAYEPRAQDPAIAAWLARAAL